MRTQMRNSRVVGIDLGTTFSLIGYWDETGKPKVIANLDGESKTPSIVYVGPGCRDVTVGTPARNMLMLERKRTIKECKRDVGTDTVYFVEGSQKITPEWCQAQILRHMRESAIGHFGDDRAASQAVITVPAYFNEQARQSVAKSAELVGIKVLQLIHEPTAAALAYGLSEKQGDRLVLVLDFGGGTFDVSLVSFTGGEANVIGTGGDRHLGGKDVDELLMNLVREAFQKEHSLEISLESHPAECFAVWDEVLRQKHMLSSMSEVKICACIESRKVVIPLSQDRLAELIKPMIDRIEKIALEMIQNANAKLGEIDCVLLVGGSSRVVAFRQMVKRVFGNGKIVAGQVSPDLAVAEGAAIHAARLVSTSGAVMVDETLQAIPAPAIKHTDVMPHSLGVAVQDRVSSGRYCSVVLEKNTAIPAQAKKQYGSVEPSQTGFDVVVVQGEEGQPIGDCLVVGERTCEFPPRDPSEPSVEVAMEYDASGMVHVYVQDLVSKKTEEITVDFYAAA